MSTIKSSKIIVGLTGGIACGKSTVLKEFKRLKVPIIDCDILARKVVARGQKGLEKIVKKFGVEILKKNGSLHRKKLASIVFSSTQKRKELEQILHPEILRLMRKEIKKISHNICIVDIPLLFEAKLQNWVDKIIVVNLDNPTQIKRLIKRNKINLTQAHQRIAAQWPNEEKLKFADYIIDNSQTKKQTYDQIKTILSQLKKTYPH